MIILRRTGWALVLLAACSARAGGGGGFFPVDGAAPADGTAPMSDGSVNADHVVADPDAPATSDVPTAPDLPTASDVLAPEDRAAPVDVAACVPGTRSCGAAGVRVCAPGGAGFVETPCVAGANQTARCEGAGECVARCADGFGDCDLLTSNGCEASLLGNPLHCGACGRRCEAGAMCANGVCASICGPRTQCGPSCVDLATDPSHCGACNNVCPPRPNAIASCASGVCVSTCAAPFGDCDGSPVTGCETNLQTSAQHCGACARPCAAGQSCVAGTCRSAPGTPRACREVLLNNPGAPSGVHSIDPDGAGAQPSFPIYCDMTTAGGGWTLVAVITNGDGVSNWSSRSAQWVTTTTFGSATTVSVNADAKTPAYGSVSGDELLVLRGVGATTVELRTATGCLGARTLLQVMSTSSVYSSTCALSCAALTQTGIFAATGTCQAAGVRFRCRDDYTATTANGFTISQGDNSFITSLANGTSCTAHQSGIGILDGSNGADIDSDLGTTISVTDTAPRYLFVR